MSDPHYDVCGSGRVLLIIPGGAGHPMGPGIGSACGAWSLMSRRASGYCPTRRGSGR
ncbi:hypothetical protein [Streptomyces sp. NPDC001530]|uniref:hypothetical protein n=1 Tax=Streptomyces sp. NPDC001530 TaxID=3364582 RepID=UPI003699E9A8